MGFFSKIKNNINHGGVDVRLDGPATAKLSDPSLTARVTISTKENPQLINKVSLQLQRETRNQSIGGRDTSAAAPTIETIARVEYTQPFTVNPGQPLSLDLNLVLNQMEAINEQLPDNDTLKGLVQGFSKLQQVSQAMNNNSYTYKLYAVADVEGISLDPGGSLPIQILKPGEVGGGFNVRL